MFVYLFLQIISRHEKYAQFFFNIADKGCELGDSDLRDSARSILRIIPPDQTTAQNLYVKIQNIGFLNFYWFYRALD